MNASVSSSSSSSSPPSSLPSPALAARLAELRGVERNVLVDFLLHLDEFDRRRDWAAAGYGSLWTYCREVLHLRESSAGRRIAAMKLLRRFPSLESALRDARLSLTTVCELGKVLTEGNFDGLVMQAAYLSAADTERLVASVQPRVAPRDGIRRIAGGAGSVAAAAPVVSAADPSNGSSAAAPAVVALGPGDDRGGSPCTSPSPSSRSAASRPSVAFELAAPPARPRHELRPVDGETYSLRVTLDASAKAELDQLVDLLSHKTRGNLAETLREAIRCALVQHGRRKGAIAPERKRRPAKAMAGALSGAEASAAASPVEAAGDAAAPGGGSEAGTIPGTGAKAAPANEPSVPDAAESLDPRYIPMDVKRAVWDRDEGCCAWTAPDGKRCRSTWRLQFGHIKPVALGGKATVDGIRLECGNHNLYEAIRVFGPEHMAPFLGSATPAGGSHPR